MKSPNEGVIVHTATKECATRERRDLEIKPLLAILREKSGQMPGALLRVETAEVVLRPFRLDTVALDLDRLRQTVPLKTRMKGRVMIDELLPRSTQGGGIDVRVKGHHHLLDIDPRMRLSEVVIEHPLLDRRKPE